MQYPFLPFFAFLAAFLVVIPFPWHWRARNVATMALMFWLFIVNIIFGVNAIVWAGNVNNPIPVWCDITTKIAVGASYALPLATLCICKHLEMVSSSRKVSYDARDRKRRMIFESIMCFLVPVIFMALHYIVQGHRFDIIENFGCQAAVYISIQAVFIIWFPQLLFAVITLIFATLALHNFIRRRLTFAAHLHNSNSALTTNRYLRLIAMALTEMIWGVVLTAYNLWSNASPGLRPWTNWADVHSDFGRVDAYPVAEVPEFFIHATLLFWWALPASSFIFFAFFGFGEDAMKEYKKVWCWFKRTVLRKREVEKKQLFCESTTSFGRGLRPLHILKLKPTSSDMSSPASYEFSTRSPTSPLSRLSQSTVTLAASPDAYENKKFKCEESNKDADSIYTREAAPAYYPSLQQDQPRPALSRPLYLDVPIDPTRDSLPLSVSETRTLSECTSTVRDSDAFTISAFSYYGSTSPTTFSPTTPPPPASPEFRAPVALPPPPRRTPRYCPSAPNVLDIVSPIIRSGLDSGVPEEIDACRPMSCFAPSSPSARRDVDETSSATTTGPMTPRPEPRVLGVPWGSVVVTTETRQRQVSVHEDDLLPCHTQNGDSVV